MATCAIAPLASSAFWNLDDHALHAAIAQLLCNLSTNLGVSTTCNPQALVLAGSGFDNLPDHEIKVCIAQLLCNISGAAAVTPQNYVGSGNPNGVVTAIPGSLYMDVSNPLNPVLWMKGSGTGNTGWE